MWVRWVWKSILLFYMYIGIHVIRSYSETHKLNGNKINVLVKLEHLFWVKGYIRHKLVIYIGTYMCFTFSMRTTTGNTTPLYFTIHQNSYTICISLNVLAAHFKKYILQIFFLIVTPIRLEIFCCFMELMDEITNNVFYMKKLMKLG